MNLRPFADAGMRLEDVDTPALLLDLDDFETNLQRLAQAVKGRVRVRAHAKTHKPGGPAPALGEKLLLVPGHCDPTVNPYDWYACVRRGVVESLWPITARGAVT